MKPTEKVKKAEVVRGSCFLLPYSFYSRKRRKKTKMSRGSPFDGFLLLILKILI